MYNPAQPNKLVRLHQNISGHPVLGLIYPFIYLPFYVVLYPFYLLFQPLWRILHPLIHRVIHPIHERIPKHSILSRHTRILRSAAILSLSVVIATIGYLFLISNAHADWYNTRWQFRKSITIDHTKVGRPQFDAQSVTNQPSSVHSQTSSHTVGSNSNRLLVVAVNANGVLNDVSTVTYGAQSLTRLTSQAQGSVGDEEIWYLVAPNSGTANITVTLTGTVTNTAAMDIAGASFYNVNQTNPLGTPNAVNSGVAQTSFTNTITTSPNQLVLDSMWTSAGSGDTYVANTGQSTLWTSMSFGIGSTRGASTSTSTTIGWSFSSDTWEDIGVGINPNSDQTNFPVLISITDANLQANAQSNGNDILFTSSDGTTKLSHEIESYDANTGKLIAWVKVPTVSSTTDTKIYMYYGNSSIASQQDATNVWTGGNYKSVWHLSESSGTNVNDSTSDAYTGTKVSATSPSPITGLFAGAQSFNGTSDEVQVGDKTNLKFTNTNSFTISMWINKSADTGSSEVALWKGGATGTEAGYDFEPSSSGWSGHLSDGVLADYKTVNFTRTNGSWQYITMVVDRTNNLLIPYTNGNAGTSVSISGVGSPDSTRIFSLGYDNAGNSFFYKGNMDEVQVSANALSIDWIATEYNNQSSPSTFITVGTQQQQKNPALYWKFDEGTGTTASDSSGNSKSGTITSATWQNKDVCLFEGSCLFFSGSGQYVKRTYSSDQGLDPGTGSFSVGAWFRHPTTMSGTQVIISRADAVAGVGYKLYYDATSGLCFATDGTAGSFPADSVCSTSNYADNQWHYIEGVKNGTSTITLYVDGRQIAQPHTMTDTNSLSGSSPPFIVGIDADSSSNAWTGFIDEVKYYDYARSASEVKADYNAKGSVLGAATSFGVGDPNSSLSQGLAGYWKMDDGVGNACASGVDKACDSSGNGNIGTWTSGVASTSGKFGYATTYNGSSAYTQVANTYSVSNSSMTISYWLNPTALPATNFSNDIVTQRQTSGASDADFATELTATGTLGFYASKNSYAQFTSCLTTNTISTGTWSLFTAVVNNNTSTVSIYINGILQNTCALTAPLNNNGGAASMRFGYQYDPSNNKYYNGKLDDVRIYNRALSPSEVTKLYDWAPGPKGWWKFDDGSGNPVDSSGNGYNGTWNLGASASKYTSGVYGKAGVFSGVSGDRVTLPTTGLTFAGGTKATIEGWVYFKTINGSNPTAIYEEQTSSNGFPRMSMRVLTTKKIELDLRDSTQDPAGVTPFKVDGTTVLSTNKWYHVAVSFNYDNCAVKIYINGVDDNAATASGSCSNGSRLGSSATNGIAIGEPTTGGGDVPINGNVDDVRIYNYDRNLKQIVSDMNSGHPPVGSPIGSAVGQWKFDEGYGTTAHNSGNCGSTCDGTLNFMSSPPTNVSGWTNDGKLGKALTFDGVDDYVGVPYTAALDPSAQITVSAWINPSRVGTYGGIVSKANGDGWDINMDNNVGQLAFEVNIGGGSTNWKTASWTYGSNLLQKWTHVVGTFDGSYVRLYINGNLKASIAASGSITPDGVNSMIIGADAGAGTTPDASSYYKGKIDEVKVYNYALNSREVYTEYNQGKSTVLGALSTDPDGRTASNSAARSYCPPGDTASNCAGGALNPAPVGEWKLDEHTGTTANDTSGNGLSLTLTNGPTWTTGKYGSGVHFDGINDVLSASDNSLFEPSTDMTMSVWVKLDRTASQAGANQTFIYKNNTTSPFLSYQMYQNSADNKVYFEYTTSGTDRTTNTSTALSAGTWYFLTFTRSGGTISIYINGVQDGTPDTGTVGNILNSDSNFYLGSVGGSQKLLQGTMDNLRIYNYARTQPEIAWDYNRGMATSYWRFDECTGTTIHNVAQTASGLASGVDGTWSGSSGTNTSAGTCNSGSSSEAWANGKTGKFNSSLHFDGSDDVVTVGNTNSIELDTGLKNGFTISTWVNATDAGEGNAGQIFNKGTNTFCRTQNPSGSLVDINCSLALATTNATVTIPSAMTTGAWHNVVLSYDGGTKITVWIDGQRKGWSTNGAGALSADANSLSFGGNGTGAGNTAAFHGQIDEVMIFPYEMTMTLVRTLYNQMSAVRFGPATGSP